jgi:transketolase
VVTDMRTQLAVTATDLLERDPRVAILLAEVSEDRFDRAMGVAPDRVVNVGIMEQTLVGAAAGFAMEGFLPIVHSMSAFLSERPFEQVKLDFGYQGLEGTLASIGASYDYGGEGATHHGPGDVGVVLTIPGAEVLVPGSAPEVDRLLRASYANGRLTYLRTSVAQNGDVFDVEPGRLEVLRNGTRATVLAVGPMLAPTAGACEGLDVTVAYVTSVRPFDEQGLGAIAGPRPLVIAVEPFYEGTILPQLTEAFGHVPSRFASIGVPRRFIHRYGTREEHDRELGLDPAGIRRRIVSFLEEPGAA